MTEATAIRADPANAGQARAWDGDEGTYWAEHAQRFDRAVAAYHGMFMAACGIARGERVLTSAAAPVRPPAMPPGPPGRDRHLAWTSRRG